MPLCCGQCGEVTLQKFVGVLFRKKCSHFLVVIQCVKYHSASPFVCCEKNAVVLAERYDGFSPGEKRLVVGGFVLEGVAETLSVNCSAADWRVVEPDGSFHN